MIPIKFQGGSLNGICRIFEFPLNPIYKVPICRPLQIPWNISMDPPAIESIAYDIYELYERIETNTGEPYYIYICVSNRLSRRTATEIAEEQNRREREYRQYEADIQFAREYQCELIPYPPEVRFIYSPQRMEHLRRLLEQGQLSIPNTTHIEICSTTLPPNDPLSTPEVKQPITQTRIDAAFNRKTPDQMLKESIEKASRHWKKKP